MLIKLNNQCSIFFGNAELCPVSYHNRADFKAFYNGVRQELGLSHLIFQRQVHGTDGWVITNSEQLTSPVMKEEREGDYLINSVASVGIGILTADCLPIIFYAPKHNIVAAAHAGWRSAVAGIGPKVVTELQEKFGVNPSDIQVYFCACAKACCYEVGSEWAEKKHLAPYLVTRDGKLYFDNPKFNKSLLITAGVPAANINEEHNDCTICNHQYHSYRRTVDKKNYDVQASIVWLTEHRQPFY